MSLLADFHMIKEPEETEEESEEQLHHTYLEKRFYNMKFIQIRKSKFMMQEILKKI